MHTAVLGPTNAAVHDRGLLGEAPALFVAAGFLSTRDRLPPPVRKASIAETAAAHSRRRNDPFVTRPLRLLQRMSPVVARPCRHSSKMSAIEGRPALPPRCRDVAFW